MGGIFQLFQIGWEFPRNWATAHFLAFQGLPWNCHDAPGNDSQYYKEDVTCRLFSEPPWFRPVFITPQWLRALVVYLVVVSCPLCCCLSLTSSLARAAWARCGSISAALHLFSHSEVRIGSAGLSWRPPSIQEAKISWGWGLGIPPVRGHCQPASLQKGHESWHCAW